MPNRRLQDRIEALVTKALATSAPDEIDKILLELRDALLEHASRLRDAEDSHREGSLQDQRERTGKGPVEAQGSHSFAVSQGDMTTQRSLPRM